MSKRKYFGVMIMLLFLWSLAGMATAQQGLEDVQVEDGKAKLVVTSISGPEEAEQRNKIEVTFIVENQGDADSGSYEVSLYLTRDKTVAPAGNDRLLGEEFSLDGLKPGESREAKVKVLIPNSGLEGKYYYGARVMPVSVEFSDVLSQEQPTRYDTQARASSAVSYYQVEFPRFTLSKDELKVTDHKTGLMWQQATDKETRTWDQAKDYCGDLDLGGGYEDWRLPNIEELRGILNSKRSSPSIDPIFKCRSERYWSSSNFVHNPDLAWAVSFHRGLVSAYSKTKRNTYVRCVRGES